MSLKVMNLAWYVDGLRPARKAVLVALADHARDDGSSAFPGVERLALKTSYSKRTVRRALSDLRDLGLIQVVKKAMYHRPTEYRLDLSEMQARQKRPDTVSGHDLTESPTDLTESPRRPDTLTAKPSVNHQKNHQGEPSEGEPAPARDAGSDAEILAFLELNGVPRPEKDRQWEELRHPATWAWLDVTRRWPGYDKLPAIIRRLGPSPDGDQLQLAWEDWLASDYNPGNVTGVLDYYDNKTEPRASPNGDHPEGEPKGFAAIRSRMEKLDDE